MSPKRRSSTSWSTGLNTYTLDFRAVGFLFPNGERECLVTNLPRDQFGIDDLKVMYGWRWGEESSYRELKYTIGILEFHSPRPELVKQEIWADMVRYNLTISLICDAVEEKARSEKGCRIETRDVAISDSPTPGNVATAASDMRPEDDPGNCRHIYRIKFTKAAEVTRKFLLDLSMSSKGLRVILIRYLEPVRPGRKEPRHMATRRRTRHFLYQAA